MQKISTMQTSEKNIFQGRLTIGLDLGDRSSAYCVLNEAGEIVLEHQVATTPEATLGLTVEFASEPIETWHRIQAALKLRPRKKGLFGRLFSSNS